MSDLTPDSPSLPKVVFVIGSTATGKSRLAVEIAHQFNGEIVSADSMQIYKGCNVATAKVTNEEMEGVPHHLLSIVDANTVSFNVQQYRDAATAAIADITRRGRLPIVVGGTHYYVQTLLWPTLIAGELEAIANQQHCEDRQTMQESATPTTSATREQQHSEDKQQCHESATLTTATTSCKQQRQQRQQQLQHSEDRQHENTTDATAPAATTTTTTSERHQQQSEDRQHSQENSSATTTTTTTTTTTGEKLEQQSGDRQKGQENSTDATTITTASEKHQQQSEDRQKGQENYRRLFAVDPVTAARLHPRDTRRVKRALEVFDSTGKTQSEWNNLKSQALNYDCCLLWVYSDVDTLDKRIESRIATMLESGLLDEQIALRQTVPSHSRSVGVFQSIGYKEFDEYFDHLEAQHTPESAKQVLSECVDKLATNTRRYARQQVRFIRHKFIDRHDCPPIYQLDSSDVSQWVTRVLAPAVAAVTALCSQTEFPEEFRCTVGAVSEDWQKYVCEHCNGRVLNGPSEWKQHLQSKLHRKRRRRQLSAANSSRKRGGDRDARGGGDGGDVGGDVGDGSGRCGDGDNDDDDDDDS